MEGFKQIHTSSNKISFYEFSWLVGWLVVWLTVARALLPGGMYPCVLSHKWGSYQKELSSLG